MPYQNVLEDLISLIYCGTVDGGFNQSQSFRIPEFPVSCIINRRIDHIQRCKNTLKNKNSEYIFLEKDQIYSLLLLLLVDVEVKLSNVNPCILFSHIVASLKSSPLGHCTVTTFCFVSCQIHISVGISKVTMF